MGDHFSDGTVRATDWADLPNYMKEAIGLFSGCHYRPEVFSWTQPSGRKRPTVTTPAPVGSAFDLSTRTYTANRCTAGTSVN